MLVGESLFSGLRSPLKEGPKTILTGTKTRPWTWNVRIKKSLIALWGKSVAIPSQDQAEVDKALRYCTLSMTQVRARAKQATI